MANIELVFAGSQQILSKFRVRLADLLALRRREEWFGAFDQTYRHGEDAHQESSILSRADQASLGDRDEFLSQSLAMLSRSIPVALQITWKERVGQGRIELRRELISITRGVLSRRHN